MIFKAIRYLIYSPLELVLEDKHIYDVDTHDPNIDIYDNYEVIGIRSEYYDHEEYVVISLKPTELSYYSYEASFTNNPKLNNSTNIEAK